MFSNIGMKIKQLSQIGFWLGVGLSVISCILLFVIGILTEEPFLCILAMPVAVTGSLLSWVSSVFSYGFGDQIEYTALIASLMVKADAKKHTSS